MRQHARERYLNLTKEKKNKKREYCGERYMNFKKMKNEKQRLAQYRKRSSETKKIIARLLNKISVFSYKSKNATVLRKPGFEFLTIKVDEYAAILAHPGTFEIK